MLDALRQDVKYAVRAVWRGPLFAATAVLSLAIGIGANTAIFSVANGLLLRPRPGIAEASRVVDVGRTNGGRGFDNLSYPNYRDLRDRSAGVLSGLAAHMLEPRPFSVRVGAGEAERAFGMTVTANIFAVLGTRPAAGRLLQPDEDRAPVVVLSHAFWTRRFAADPSVVGSAIVVNGQPRTVVGVAERGFTGTSVVGADLYLPIATAAPGEGGGSSLLEDRRAVWLQAVGRLRPGASVEQARAALEGIGAQLAREYPEENRDAGVAVAPTGPIPVEARGPVTAFVAVLMGVVGLVLLIACVNVTGMMLARASARRREIAVRLALGAARGRLVRQLVTEGMVLFAAAAGAGVLFATWMLSALGRFRPPVPFPVELGFAVDGRALAFTALLSAAAGVLSALAPALQSSRADLVAALKGEAGAVGTRLRRLKLRSGLVVAQVALSVLLLIGAGLFLRALTRASSIDPGFDPAGVEVVTLDLSLGSLNEERGEQFARELVARTSALPGVESAAMGAMLPLSGGGLGLGAITIPGRESAKAGAEVDADWNVVTPGFLRSIRTPLVRGRDFAPSDVHGAPAVAIVNETAAREWWPGQDALGKVMLVENRPLTVVGVAREAKYRSLGDRARPFVFVPLSQRYFTRMSLLVRSAGAGVEGARHTAAVRTLVKELAPDLPVVDAQSLSDFAAAGLMPQRLALWVSGSFGAVGLLLAVVGVYGVTAYAAARRTREFGVRVALGATRGDVARLVLREGALLAAAGIGIGTAAALGAARLLGSFLFGVPPLDPPAFLGAVALLAAVTLAASYLPARRAARVDAMRALRAE